MAQPPRSRPPQGRRPDVRADRRGGTDARSARPGGGKRDGAPVDGDGEPKRRGRLTAKPRDEGPAQARDERGANPRTDRKPRPDRILRDDRQPRAQRSPGEDRTRKAAPALAGKDRAATAPRGKLAASTRRPAPDRAERPAPAAAPAPARRIPAQLKSEREDGLHRIAKLLARAGVASRRDIERMIEEGRIAIDGVTVTTPATLLANLGGVTVNGAPVDEPEATRLFLFHKPAGVLTAARDPGGRPTIYDRLPPDLPRLMPVGRLDLNTEGLLLLTSDGALKRKLELPSSGVERTYRARAFGEVSQAQLEDLVEGVEIDGMRYGRIDANLERRTGRNTWIEMTLTEGKNREVRRVLEHLGLKVARLIRTRYGPFVLGSSAPGQVEEASPAEVEKLLKQLR